MFFRFTARAGCPQTAFNFGARTVDYFGKEVSRRSFHRQRSPAVFGFIDTTKLISTVPASAFASIWCKEQSEAGGIVQLGSEDSLNGMLGRMLASANCRVGASASAMMDATAGALSRTLLSNAMAMQWTLCCKIMAVMITMDRD
jgi:hypothetical protein